MRISLYQTTDDRELEQVGWRQDVRIFLRTLVILGPETTDSS